MKKPNLEETGLTESDIIQIYNEGKPELKESLVKIFGREFFSGEWMELFKAFCKKNNLTITYDYAKRKEAGFVYLPHENPVDAEDEHENASKMLRVIIGYNNKEKNFIVDYSNAKQERWFPIGKVTSAGLVFAHTLFEYWVSDSFALVGAPFVSPTSDKAKRLFIEYLPIYNKYYKIK